MGPDDEIENEDEVSSDQELEQSNVAESETEKDPKAVKGESARESIRRALKQHTEKEDKNESQERQENSEKDDGSSGDEEDGEKEEVKTEKKEKTKKEAPKVKISAATPPPGWTKEAKSQWNNLPQEVRDSVAKREQEASDGFKDYGEKVRAFETKEKDYNEINSSFQGREPELQRLGVSKGQVVKQMFQWIDALSHTDRNYAKSQLIQLGKNYGIDLEEKPAASTQQTETKPEIPELPAELKSFADTINNRFNAIETNAQKEQRERQDRELQQQRQNADAYVNNWAKDKPHFQTVRQAMFGLLQSGSIPLKDGQLDLDEAYNQAVYANPVTREAIRKEEADKEEAEKEQQRKDKELKNLRKIKNAKAASSSISSRAPTGVSAPNTGKKGQPASVRDSIKAAIAEMRENQ